MLDFLWSLRCIDAYPGVILLGNYMETHSLVNNIKRLDLENYKIPDGLRLSDKYGSLGIEPEP